MPRALVLGEKSSASQGITALRKVGVHHSLSGEKAFFNLMPLSIVALRIMRVKPKVKCCIQWKMEIADSFLPAKEIQCDICIPHFFTLIIFTSTDLQT